MAFHSPNILDMFWCISECMALPWVWRIFLIKFWGFWQGFDVLPLSCHGIDTIPWGYTFWVCTVPVHLCQNSLWPFWTKGYLLRCNPLLSPGFVILHCFSQLYHLRCICKLLKILVILHMPQPNCAASQEGYIAWLQMLQASLWSWWTVVVLALLCVWEWYDLLYPLIVFWVS